MKQPQRKWVMELQWMHKHWTTFSRDTQNMLHERRTVLRALLHKYMVDRGVRKGLRLERQKEHWLRSALSSLVMGTILFEQVSSSSSRTKPQCSSTDPKKCGRKQWIVTEVMPSYLAFQAAEKG